MGLAAPLTGQKRRNQYESSHSPAESQKHISPVAPRSCCCCSDRPDHCSDQAGIALQATVAQLGVGITGIYSNPHNISRTCTFPEKPATAWSTAGPSPLLLTRLCAWTVGRSYLFTPQQQHTSTAPLRASVTLQLPAQPSPSWE